MRIHYLREDTPHGIRPFATIVILDDGRIGASLCSPEDNFSREQGIFFATKRAESKDRRRNLPRLKYRKYQVTFVRQGLRIACCPTLAIQDKVARLLKERNPAPCIASAAS